MVINIGKALAGDWAYVEKDIRTVVREAHKRGAIVKVIFENDFLPGDAIKKKLCRISEKAGADFVKTSTGYGFVKGADGTYSYQGATEHDLVLMRKAVSREGAGESRRRRARSRRADARARPRHDALRRDRDGGDARRLPEAREGGAAFGFFGCFGCFRRRRLAPAGTEWAPRPGRSSSSARGVASRAPSATDGPRRFGVRPAASSTSSIPPSPSPR